MLKGRNVERVGMSKGSKETSKRVTRWIRRKQLVFRSPLKQLNPRNRTSGDMFLNGGRLWLQLRLSREKKEISLLFREIFLKFFKKYLLTALSMTLESCFNFFAHANDARMQVSQCCQSPMHKYFSL